MGTMRGILIAVSALAFSASAASAQKTLSLGISGGLTIPTGEMADAQASGYHVGGHLNLAPESLPVELLFDATFHSFGGNLDLPLPVDFTTFGVSGSAAYVIGGTDMRPYLMGGIGMYFSKADVPGADSQSDFGFNFGGGVRFMLSGMTTFLQARANIVKDNTFIPISFGILF